MSLFDLAGLLLGCWIIILYLRRWLLLRGAPR